MALRWLLGIGQSLMAQPPTTGGRKPRLSSIDIGYCPDCHHLRATTSLGCTYCGSTASVTADA